MQSRGDVLDFKPCSNEAIARFATFHDLHRDPFDRLIVAQALYEDLTLVTVDPIIAKYAVATIDARG